MSDAHALHISLLKPAILHILRASGFHSTRPSVLDTLTDLCARHLLLLGQATAASIYARTANDEINNNNSSSEPSTILTHFSPPVPDRPSTYQDPHTPTLSDVRHALDSTAFFAVALTPAEEAWREVLRTPLSTYPAGPTRDKERARRDLDDTRDVREFVDWCTGPANREIRRIAGMLSAEQQQQLVPGASSATAAAVSAAVATLPAAPDAAASSSAGVPRASGSAGKEAVDGQGSAAAEGKESADAEAMQAQAEFGGGVNGILGVGVGAAGRPAKDDYVAALKKKHSKTGDGARYAGTALGKAGEEKGIVRIEGGPESLAAWALGVKRKRVEVEGEG